MKNKASVFFKQVVHLLKTIVKAKSMAIKNKTSAAKARLIMFSLLKNKKVLLGSISDKIHGLLGHQNKEDDHHDHDQSKAIVVFNSAMVNEPAMQTFVDRASVYSDDDDDDDDKYPDLRHCLFDEEEDLEFEDHGGSIIDMVRHSKEEEGQDFSLDEEIDHVADLFIKRFHKQMRLQKQESFKRFQEMMARSV